MRIADLGGRAPVLTAAGAVDLAEASGGTLPSDLQGRYDQWPEVLATELDHSVARNTMVQGATA